MVELSSSGCVVRISIWADQRLNKDGGHENALRAKPKHLDHPLVAGYRIPYEPLLFLHYFRLDFVFFMPMMYTMVQGRVRRNKK